MVFKVVLPDYKTLYQAINLTCKRDARQIPVLYGITQPIELIMYFFDLDTVRVSAKHEKGLATAAKMMTCHILLSRELLSE